MSKQKNAVQRLCSLEGCRGKHYGRGLCQKHYDQWRVGKLDYTPPAKVQREWSAETQNNRKLYSKYYYQSAKGRGVLRKAYLKRAYNITPEYYNQMSVEQEGRCAICGKYQSEFKESLSVDHEHNSGQIRGLLCPKCNTGLGQFQDSIDRLVCAILYLMTPIPQRLKYDYDTLFEEQNGCCKICNLSYFDIIENGLIEFAVDHDHKCCPRGKKCSKCIRGLLCRDCNMGLGLFSDDVEIMKRAISYLESFKQLNTLSSDIYLPQFDEPFIEEPDLEKLNEYSIAQ